MFENSWNTYLSENLTMASPAEYDKSAQKWNSPKVQDMLIIF